MLDNLFDRMDSILLGSILQMRRANHILQSKIDACDPDHFEKDERLQHSNEALEREVGTSVTRVQEIEGKAMATLLGVGVAVAVLGVASGFIGPGGIVADQHWAVRIAVAVLLICSLAYLFGSGFLALQSYKIGTVYRPTLSDIEPIVEPERRGRIQLFCIEQNNRMGTLRSNRLVASFNCFRNGIAALGILGILIVIAGSLCQAPPEEGCLVELAATEFSHLE